MDQITAFVAGGIVFLLIFFAGAWLGAYLSTKPAEAKEPEFSHVEGGKRVCQRV